MNELVSVLIPMYNAETWIASTLLCVQSQTWPNIETIVVDDGSTDESLRIARKFEDTNLKVIAQKNRGACAARNRALQEAQGNYLQFLDADDLMEANKIAVQMRRLLKEPPGTVASTRWARFFKEIGDGLHPPVPEQWEYEDPMDWLTEAHAGRAMMPPLGWLTPREIVEEAGPWNEDLMINQDGEYFTRVLLNAERIAFCTETAVHYRSGIPSSVSKRFSPAVLHSKYEASRSIMKHMLVFEDTVRVRRASADAFQRIAYQAHPVAPDVAAKAEAQVQKLGGSAVEPSGGGLFQVLGRKFGWKYALWIRHHYRNLRY